MFDEILLDPDLSEGAVGGGGWNTIIIETASGAEQRVALQSRPRGRWNLTNAELTQAQCIALIAFFHARRGRLRGFRFKDWTDYQATQEALVNPYPAAAMQLIKTYSNGGQSVVRDIKKPVSGSVTLERNTGSGYAAWAVGGNWTLDTTTGIVTITTPTSGHLYRWSGEFDVPVRFDIDQLPIAGEAAVVRSVDSIPLVELLV